MELDVAILLIAAGLAVGFINNLAGAAGALGLITLESLLGLPTMTANATMRPSAVALALAGMVGFLSKGHKVPTKMWGYALLTVPGAVLGALMVAPKFELLFRLILTGLLLVTLVQQLRNRKPTAQDDTRKSETSLLVMALLFTWLGGHMGFVQIATGLVAIFILTLVHSQDLVQVNAAKMALVLAASSASTITLTITDRIQWLPALFVALGAAIGSFTASRWSVRKGHGAVRTVVVVICVAVLLRLGYQFVASIA